MITAKVVGADKVISNIMKITDSVKEEAKNRVMLAGDTAHVIISNQAGFIDSHTQEWLNAHAVKIAGRWRNPYSAVRPSGYPHPDDADVHIQTGRLHENIQKLENINQQQATIEIGVNEGDVPYIADLINGSPVMRPRNFISRGFEKSIDEIDKIMKG